MNLLFTIDKYPPDVGGGATEVVRQLAERMVARGHSVTIATSWTPSRRVSQYLPVTIKGFRLRPRLGQSILGITGDPCDYLAEIESPVYDIVMHYAAQTWHADLSLAAPRTTGAPRILCACGFSGLLGWRRFLYLNYYRKMPLRLAAVDRVVCHSRHYLDYYACVRWGLEAKTVVIPNAVDRSELSGSGARFREKFSLGDMPIALCVGDHFKNKGHDRVIKAMSHLKTRNLRLVIIGRNNAGRFSSCIGNCTSVARASNGRIIVVDGACREDVIDAYHAASVFVSGSRIEAFPLVILEAMAVGLPFVAFPAGNIKELEGGIVVDSEQAMAGAIDEIVRNRGVYTTLSEAGANAQRASYSWEAVVDKYELLFEDVLKTG